MSQEQQEQETKKNFMSKIDFGPKLVSDQRYFRTQNLFWGPKFVLDPNYLGTKYFSGPKIVFRPNIFLRPKKCFGPQMNLNEKQSLEGENRTSELKAF